MNNKKKQLFINKGIEYYVFILIVFISFVIYVYSDPVITQRDGIEVWYALFDGNLLRFHELYGGAYPFPIYIIFAIWNLPTWLYEVITGMNAQDKALWLLYGKGLMLFSYWLYLYFFMKLLDSASQVAPSLYKCFDREDMLRIVACSFYMLIYTIWTGNYEIMPIIFVLIGLKNLFEGKDNRFIFWFAIASCIKYYALLLFVPILLLKEKRLLKVALKTLTVACPVVAIQIIIPHETAGFVKDLGSSIISGARIENVFGVGTVSLSFILYAIFLLWCYLQEINDMEELVRKVFYASFVSFGIFLVVGINGGAFRRVLIIPFLVLLVYGESKNLFLSVICETLLNLAFFIQGVLIADWILGGESLYARYLFPHVFLVKRFNIEAHYLTIGNALKKYLFLTDNNVYINSILLVAFIVIVIIKYPGRTVQSKIADIQYSMQSIRKLLMIRNAFNVLIFLSPTIYYYYQAITFYF